MLKGAVWLSRPAPGGLGRARQDEEREEVLLTRVSASRSFALEKSG